METRTAVLAGAIALAASTIPGAADAGWDSRWRAEPLGEDGSVTSWSGVKTKSDAGIEIGAVNDGANLWVRLIPKDARAQMGLMAGVTVWFGEEDAADRFGIRIAPERPEEPMRRGDRGDRDDRPDPARMGARLRDALKTVDILTARGMTDRTIPVPAELGVDVRVEVTQVAALVVRVPLAGGGDGPALAAGPGDEIRVEVQGEELRPGPPPGGGFPGGGRPGGGGPGLGGGRGGPGGMRGGPPERVDFHAKLKLAAGTDG